MSSPPPADDPVALLRLWLVAYDSDRNGHALRCHPNLVGMATETRRWLAAHGEQSVAGATVESTRVKR